MTDFLEKNLVPIFLSLASIILSGVVGIYWIYFNDYSISPDNSNWGDFGSFVGGVSSAFLSFLTILLLALTLKNQSKLSRITQFEQSFFELFNLHQSITEKMDGEVQINTTVDWAPKPYHGLGYINACSQFLENEFSGISDLVRITDRDKKVNLKKSFQSEIDECYDFLYKGKETQLGHYFRSIYNIMKFINESNVPEKKKYFDLLQSFLTDSELHLIFYNGIGRHGRKRLRQLMDEYSFLENIHPKGQTFLEHFKQFYPKTYTNHIEKPSYDT
ncbi:MAG: putative phage abortive infection protein [Balneola sp.]